MKKYWSKRILTQEAYVPGEQPKNVKRLIKLNTNESPYPPSPKAIDAINTAALELRLYPDPNYSELESAICDVYGIEKGMVFAGNGSDEVLAMSFLAFFDTDRTIRFPDITYSFYPVYANLFGINYELVHVNDDFTIPCDSLTAAVGGIIIANPNALTGISLSVQQIEEMVRESECVVIVDEAYVDFGGESVLPLVFKYPNLLVVRTTSKSLSLAGLRVGWAMGDPSLIAALNVVKNSINSYTLSRTAIAGAAAAILDTSYYSEMTAKIIGTRSRITERLCKLGFSLTDSKANFVFAQHDTVSASELYKELRERGILVRHFNEERINNRLRITIGSDDEMDELIRELERIL